MPSDGAGSPLEAASALAHRIAGSAVWCGDRCNWMGSGVGDLASARSEGREWAALGPDLYAGTAGVALALAHAAATLDDAQLRAAALGAIGHACDGATQPDARARDGLHGGAIGIVFAAARVARVLGCEATLASACELLGGWRRRRGAALAWDVFAGRAGTVSGLLALGDLIDEPWLVDTAADAGDELLAGARRSPAGWSWPAPGRRGLHDLCGFAHGAAGIGHALAELHGATGEQRFREGAEQAFLYERMWYRELAAWPDLRDVGRRARRGAPVPLAGATWCHGAAGIAISRLRAARLVGGEAVTADARAAMRDTREVVRGRLARAPRDATLCHGDAGAADVLLYAAHLDGAGARDDGALAMQVGERVVRADTTGAAFGPGLFLGLAGTVLLCLRLHDPTLPTPLAIHPAERLTRGADVRTVSRPDARGERPWQTPRI